MNTPHAASVGQLTWGTVAFCLLPLGRIIDGRLDGQERAEVKVRALCRKVSQRRQRGPRLSLKKLRDRARLNRMCQFRHLSLWKHTEWCKAKNEFHLRRTRQREYCVVEKALQSLVWAPFDMNKRERQSKERTDA